MRTEPAAFRLTERPARQREQNLLAHYIFEQKTAMFIIPDFGLFFRDRMLAHLRIRIFGAKDKIELTGERPLHRVKSARAEQLYTGNKMIFHARFRVRHRR